MPLSPKALCDNFRTTTITDFRMPHATVSRRSPGQRRPRKKSHPLAERLRQVIKYGGVSQAEFARRCGVDPPRVTDWLSARQLPSAAHLIAIGERLGLSLDWLLFGDAPDGTTDETRPVYRGQVRRQATLESDLERAIARLANQQEPEAWSRASVRGADVITEAAGGVVQECRLRRDAERESRDEISSLAGTVASGGSEAPVALETLVKRARRTAILGADTQRLLRIARSALEQIDRVQGWADRLNAGASPPPGTKRPAQ